MSRAPSPSVCVKVIRAAVATAATLGLAAFVFLGAFFAAGLLTNRLLKGAQ